MQRDSVQAVTEDIRASKGLADLIETAWQIRRLALRLLAQGVAVEQLTRVLSELRGALTERIIADAARRFPLRAPWAWLALGSEGRHEQGLEADQDNALIVGMDSTDPGAMTQYLAFARTVNAGLAACGFPHCEGGIIASNPNWCRTLSGWRAAACRWIRNPDPAALLNMRILLDARPIAGDRKLADLLRTDVLKQAESNPAFCSALAESALRLKPTLNVLSAFPFAERNGRRIIDLKRSGTRPFVDAARVLATAAGRPETSTAERLRALRTVRLPSAEADAAVEGLHYFLGLRLKYEASGDRVPIDCLNAIERGVLKESLVAAARLQRRIRVDYCL